MPTIKIHNITHLHTLRGNYSSKSTFILPFVNIRFWTQKNYSLEVLLKQWYEPFRNETLDMQHILLVHIKIYIPALLSPKKKKYFI
jgi:hypothetical protein